MSLWLPRGVEVSIQNNPASALQMSRASRWSTSPLHRNSALDHVAVKATALSIFMRIRYIAAPMKGKAAIEMQQADRWKHLPD